MEGYRGWTQGSDGERKGEARERRQTRRRYFIWVACAIHGRAEGCLFRVAAYYDGLAAAGASSRGSHGWFRRADTRRPPLGSCARLQRSFCLRVLGSAVFVERSSSPCYPRGAHTRMPVCQRFSGCRANFNWHNRAVT